jgi:adenosylmethionine-8-amino-7-oxononanoate aminotransferase
MRGEMVFSDHIFYRDLTMDFPTIERGEGVFLYDAEGNRYLDACSGSAAANVGYGRTEVVEAMAEQARRITYLHSYSFKSQALLDVTERIAALAPPGMSKVWLISSGSEAAESALKLARHYHLGRGKGQKYKFVGRWNSHHGVTIGALSMSGFPWDRWGMGPLLLDFPLIVPPYCYRCPLDKVYPDCGVACADELERTIQSEGPESISGVIMEPVTSPILAGLAPPAEYYPRVREICDEYDVLFVADEVMTGFGRTGSSFAITQWGVKPDIIIFGKGVSGGYSPLAGMIVADEISQVIMEELDGKFRHGHSYGGNPLSAAIGVAVLDILEREGLVDRARRTGQYLLDRLEELRAHPTVGEIRGRGLMVGLEFVRDKETKEPFAPEAGFAMEIRRRARDKGVLVFPGGRCINGVAGDQIFLTPPLIVSREDIDQVVFALDGCLSEAEAELL